MDISVDGHGVVGKSGEMRSFFNQATVESLESVSSEDTSVPANGRTHAARVAVYDSPMAAPRTFDVGAADEAELIEAIASSVYERAREAGGSIPYTAIREVSENFIHANFREPVVSIMDGGNTVRFADQGPGICDKTRALLPGFTTATSDMKRYIRGVGSGLPIVQEYLSYSGGSLRVEDNLGSGSVVTISLSGPAAHAAAPARNEPSGPAGGLFELDAAREGGTASVQVDEPRLSARQRRVLALVLESGEAGPSLVARELSIGLSTAHRDLAHLESLGLVVSDDSGKRSLSEAGVAAAESLLL